MVLIQLYIVNHTQVNTNFSGLLSKSYVYLLYTFWIYLLSLTCTISTQYFIIIKYRTYWQFIRPSSPYKKSFWVHFLTSNNLLQLKMDPLSTLSKPQNLAAIFKIGAIFFIFRVPRRWHLLFPRPWKKVGSGIHHYLLHKYVHVTSQTYIVVVFYH